MALANFVDQKDAPSFSALTSFPSLADFSVAATADALKWVDLEQNVVYQILPTRTVNTQHGQSVILSLQKDGGSSFSVCACGMLSRELLQNPMIMMSSRLFVVECTIHINCYSAKCTILFLPNIYIYIYRKMEFNSLFTRLNHGVGVPYLNVI